MEMLIVEKRKKKHFPNVLAIKVPPTVHSNTFHICKYKYSYSYIWVYGIYRKFIA